MTGTSTIWNGSQQISGASSNDVELTLEQYEALPDSKNSDNVNYYIKDAFAPGQTINGIQFRIHEGKLQYRYNMNMWADPQ